MNFARWTFRVAGIYGLMLLAPMYFLEHTVSAFGEPILHPEYYYGFLGVACAWQVAFLVIAADP